jgi:hypothetical protein
MLLWRENTFSRMSTPPSTHPDCYYATYIPSFKRAEHAHWCHESVTSASTPRELDVLGNWWAVVSKFIQLSALQKTSDSGTTAEIQSKHFSTGPIQRLLHHWWYNKRHFSQDKNCQVLRKNCAIIWRFNDYLHCDLSIHRITTQVNWMQYLQKLMTEGE